MQTYELTQKILAFGPTYEVCPAEAPESDPRVTTETIPAPLAVLAAVAVDPRFFQE